VASETKLEGYQDCTPGSEVKKKVGTCLVPIKALQFSMLRNRASYTYGLFAKSRNFKYGSESVTCALHMRNCAIRPKMMN